MQVKTIKISFNSKFFLKSHKAIWAFSNNKKITPYIVYTVLGSLCLFVGLTLEKGEKFPIITILGGGYLFYMSLTWIGLLERRIKYFKKVKNQSFRYDHKSIESIYIFSENCFEYQDEEKSFSLSWILFKPFIIYKDNIMLILKDGGITFTISRSELSDSDYNELCNILKERLG